MQRGVEFADAASENVERNHVNAAQAKADSV